MPDIILHHYPQSPVSEKVRVVLGMKRLAWRSVEIPRLPPKPDLVPLTGGYRLTPVLQIGADIYCDSQCIIRELEERAPEPSLFPGGGFGMPWGVSRWTDGPLFTLAIALVFADGKEGMPEAFQKDRLPLYFGPDVDLAQLQADLPHTQAQLRGQLAWLEQRLAGGRSFILGEPSLADALGYYLLWFIRGRYSKGAEFLAQFPSLCAWEERVRAIGHGRPTDMSALEALETAQAATPASPKTIDGDDPQKFAAGDAVTVTPLRLGGLTGVSGRLRRLDLHTVAVDREDERVGAVAVHFPRVGYRVAPA